MRSMEDATATVKLIVMRRVKVTGKVASATVLANLLEANVTRARVIVMAKGSTNKANLNPLSFDTMLYRRNPIL